MLLRRETRKKISNIDKHPNAHGNNNITVRKHNTQHCQSEILCRWVSVCFQYSVRSEEAIRFTTVAVRS